MRHCCSGHYSGDSRRREGKLISTILVIDVGSAYLKAAYSFNGTNSILRLSADEEFLPAVVNIAADGCSSVGLEAVHKSAGDDAGLFREWKSWFAPNETVWIRDTERPVEEMLGFLFGHVNQRWRAELSSAPDEVVVLHPSSWTSEQISGLCQAARTQWATVAPCSVAVAAIREHMRQTGVRSGSVVVVDMGAALCDISRVTFADQSIVSIKIPVQLPPLGGNDFDEALTSSILSNLGETARLGSDRNEASFIEHLRREARRVKERLSTELVADLTLGGPAVTRRVSRTEFEECIDDQVTDMLTRAATELGGAASGTGHGDVILLGGSSKVPLVRAKVRTIFRGSIVPGLSSSKAVLWGALVATEPAQRADYVVAMEQPFRTPGRRLVPLVLALALVVGLAITIGIAAAHRGDNAEGLVGGGSTSASSAPSSTSSSAPIPVPSMPVPPSPTLPTAQPLAPALAIVPLGQGLATRLHIVNATSPSDPIELSTPGVGGSFNPILSADRRSVLYVNNRSGAVNVMAVDGTEPTQIFSPPENCDFINHVSWHPTDDSILVIQCDVDDEGRLYLVNWRTSAVSLLSTPGSYVEDPTISPDGEWVAFWSGRSRKPNGGVLYIARLDGQGEPTKLSKFEGIDADPAWTPDGQSIAYRHTGVEGGSDIYIVSVTTLRTDKPLTSQLDEEKPTWSPDGTRFLYVTSDPEVSGRESLHVYDVAADRRTSLDVASKNISTGVWWHR